MLRSEILDEVKKRINELMWHDAYDISNVFNHLWNRKKEGEKITVFKIDSAVRDYVEWVTQDTENGSGFWGCDQ